MGDDLRVAEARGAGLRDVGRRLDEAVVPQQEIDRFRRRELVAVDGARQIGHRGVEARVRFGGGATEAPRGGPGLGQDRRAQRVRPWRDDPRRRRGDAVACGPRATGDELRGRRERRCLRWRRRARDRGRAGPRPTRGAPPRGEAQARPSPATSTTERRPRSRNPSARLLLARCGPALGGGGRLLIGGRRNRGAGARSRRAGTWPFSSPKTSSPNLSSAWKSPTSGGDQAAAGCGLPSGTSIRNMFSRQVSPTSAAPSRRRWPGR